MREVTLGLIQMEPKLGDTVYNCDHAIGMIREAARKGAQIVVLPETAITGYDLTLYDRQAFYDMAETLEGRTVTRLRETPGSWASTSWRAWPFGRTPRR